MPVERIFSDLNDVIRRTENGLFRWGYIDGRDSLPTQRVTNIDVVEGDTISPNLNPLIRGLADSQVEADSLKQAPWIIAVLLVAAFYFYRKQS